METEESTRQSPVSRIRELLESREQDLQGLLEELNVADLADVLESSPAAERVVLWNLFEEEQQSEIIQHINEDIVPSLLGDKSGEEIAGVLENVDDDDIVDILQQLPQSLSQQVLLSMDIQDRGRVENLLSYPEDTAGGIMDTDTISVRAPVTLDVVLRYLRRHAELPPMTDSIYVVNTRDEFIGLLPVSTLLVSDPSLTVREMMVTEAETISADTSTHDVAAIFERYDLVSASMTGADTRS